MTVTGRVLLKETGVGLPELQVSFFLVDPVCTAEFTAALAAPPDIPGHRARGLRLGSVLTDTWGRFTFNYECGQPGADLVVAVGVSEQGPGRCGITTLQTVCIPQAATNESCLMRVERQRLLDAGGILPESEVAVRTPPGLMDLFAKAKKGLKPVDGAKIEVPFSQTYKQRRNEWQKLLADNSPPAPRLGPQNVRAYVAMAGAPSLRQVDVSPRPDGTLVVRLDDRPDPLVLRFDGADYKNPPQTPKGGVLLEIDEQSGTFRVVVPTSDGELRSPEFPSQLYYVWQAPRIAAASNPQPPSEPE